MSEQRGNPEPFGGPWRSRRVLVTGHTGFKGSWLTLWLRELGTEVSGLALEPPTTPNLFDALGWGPESARGGWDRRGDVRDLLVVESALLESQAEVVFHLAAQPLVRRSYVEPRETFETNVMGTVNVLEACRRLHERGAGPTAVIVITSDKCYENREDSHAYVESDALGGWDPYSASKGCAELVVAAYRRSFGLTGNAPRIASARAGNVIGGGDWGADRLVPDCAAALSRGEQIEVRNPAAVRPWQHVLEPLSGYLCLAAAMLDTDQAGYQAQRPDAGAWNFGPGAAADLSVRDVVDLVLASWGGGSWRQAPGAGARPHEAGLLRLDSSKAQAEIGWRPIWDAREAVEVSMRWYRDFYDGADASLLLQHTRADIQSYVESAARQGVAWAGGVRAS